MLLIRDHFENLIGLSRSQEICWVVTPSGKVQHGSPAVWAPTSELFFLPTGVRKQLLFSRSVVSDSLWPHGLQRARPPCLSPTPGVYSDSCPLSQWCHPTISSSVIPFSSSLQSSPASVFSDESALLIRWLKYWSFSFNISPSNEHPRLICFRMDWLALLNPFKDLRSVQQVFGGAVFLLEAQWRNGSDKRGKPGGKQLHDVLRTRRNLLCILWNHFPFVANPGRQPINQEIG